MKTVTLLLFILFLPLAFFGQRSLTGLWTGILTNDSNTVRKQQPFELALTQYKEKVYGYSRSSFIVDDTLYYAVKRVKGTIEGDLCEIAEDEILSSNFPVRPAKGVKVTISFRRNLLDSTWHLNGDWKTNKTKNFYSISGKIALTEEKNLDQSKLLPHLEELKLADDIAFYVETKRSPAPVVINNKPLIPEKREVSIVKTEPPSPAIGKETKQQSSKDIAEPVVKEMAAIQQPAEENRTPLDKTAKPEIVKPGPVSVPAIPGPVLSFAAAHVNERKTIAPQIVSFRSDSLELSLYDNGEIDGDTVSILLNDEIIMPRQGLKASAIKKTIYIPAGTDSVSLILYAENLGKYPPNTGLLVVRDKDDVYQIRFSADLQQNAMIVFRRALR